MREELKKLIEKHNHPELAEKNGHVTQVWEDGEVTSQKSGSLLCQRTMFTFEKGCGLSVDIAFFPNQNEGHGYIFTDDIGAYEIRLHILKLAQAKLSADISNTEHRLKQELVKKE